MLGIGEVLDFNNDNFAQVGEITKTRIPVLVSKRIVTARKSDVDKLISDIHSH